MVVTVSIDLNRFIAADSYVSDVLPGAGSDNHPHEKKLLPRNWVDDVENYARVGHICWYEL